VHTVCTLLDELRPDPAGPYTRLITHVKDRPGHDRRYAIDARKIERELGWRPAETFDIRHPQDGAVVPGPTPTGWPRAERQLPRLGRRQLQRSMKLLLLGKNGQVGWELQRALAPLGKLVACDFDSPGDDRADFSQPESLVRWCGVCSPT
jgi:hypothetical protein